MQDVLKNKYYTPVYPSEISINGRAYINRPAFLELFECSEDMPFHFRKRGMPCIKVRKRFYYNVEDCRAWFAGKYEEG